MRPDIDNIIYILIYLAFLISIIGSLVYFCKESLCSKINDTFIKTVFYNRLRYLYKLIPKQYFVFQKYDIWRYCSLF